jgi:hypothetical protein
MSATATQTNQAPDPAAMGGTGGDVVAVPIPQPQPEQVETGAAAGAAGAAPAGANAKRFKIGKRPKPPKKVEVDENAASSAADVAGGAPGGTPAAARESATGAEAPATPKRPFFLFVLTYRLVDGVLEGLNRPFAWVPRGARGAIGGAAVVTLVMAVAGGLGGPLLWPRSSALDAIERRKAELRAAEAAAAAAALETAHATKTEKKGEAKHGEKADKQKTGGGH